MDKGPPYTWITKKLCQYFGGGGGGCAPKDSNPELGSTSQLGQGSMFYINLKSKCKDL